MICFVALAICACGSNSTTYTIQDYCHWQTHTDFATCMSNAEDCASISNQNEPSIQCMAELGYLIPDEADIPTNGN